MTGTSMSGPTTPASASSAPAPNSQARIGDHLQPGFYSVYCKYHAYLGMIGMFTVTP